MTVRIERITVDDEPRRRFFLLAEVTFSDAHKDGGRNYYDDDELAAQVSGWVDSALDDRDDSPAVKFHSLPQILDVDVKAVASGEYLGHTTETV